MTDSDLVATRSLVTALLRHPTTWRGAWWAYRSLPLIRRDLATSGLAATPPRFDGHGPNSVAGVELVMALRHATCLERSLLLQQCILGVRGHAPDVVIGVADGTETPTPVQAHAWIDGTDPGEFAVIHRIPVP